MLYLVTGGSGSGKSEYAEQLAVEQKHNDGNLYYVATMYPFKDSLGNVDAETKRRIERHRQLRKDKGFTTLEQYTEIEKLSFGDRDVVLLECMSNLLANEMYLEAGRLGKEGDEKKFITEPLLHLSSQVKNLIVVTNEIFSDGKYSSYDESTQLYIRLLSAINSSLAREADYAVEVCCGIPVSI